MMFFYSGVFTFSFHILEWISFVPQVKPLKTFYKALRRSSDVCSLLHS